MATAFSFVLLCLITIKLKLFTFQIQFHWLYSFFPFNQFRCLLLDDWNKIYRHRNRFWTFWAMPRRILCYVYSLYLCAQLKQGSHRNSKMGLTRTLGNSKENSVDVVVPQAEYMCFFFVFIVQRCLFHLSGKLAAVRINKNITKNHTHNNTQIGT